jgi:hypothetical protein
MEWWYELDASDRLVAVGGEWDRFALENGAPAAAAAGVVGRPLWDFVAGFETVHLLRRIVHSARVAGRPVEAPFRCDGPGLERHMHFRAELVDGGGVRVTTRLLREVPLDASPAAEAPAPRCELLRMCSWCNRIRVDDGRWMEPAEAVAQLGLFTGPGVPPITHGMCAGCMEAMEPLLDAQPFSATA